MRGDGLEVCVLVVPYTREIRVAGSKPVDCAMQRTTFRYPDSRQAEIKATGVATLELGTRRGGWFRRVTRPEEGAKWGHDGNSEIDVVHPSVTGALLLDLYPSWTTYKSSENPGQWRTLPN